MKKILTLFIITIIGTSVNASGATYSGGGEGTEVNPYQIATFDDLVTLSNTFDDWSKHFILTANIDASASSTMNLGDHDADGGTADVAMGFSPIGTYDLRFTGSFDGQNHEISNLYMNRPSQSFIALIGATNGGSVINIAVVDCLITGYSYVAGVVGFNVGTDILNSHTTGTFDGRYSVGGLVGLNSNSAITNCYASINVNGTIGADMECIGGLVGTNISNATISNCYSTGSVISTGNTLGGLVGSNTFSATIIDSYSNATVNGNSSIGGLVGRHSNSSIIVDSYATGAVTGIYSTGGLVGFCETATVENSYSTGNVSGDSYTGGLIGRTWSSSQVTNSYSNSNINSTGQHVGGLIGAHENSILSNSFATGSIINSSGAGGLIGSTLDNSTVSNCYASSSVSGAGVYVGGLIGMHENSTVSNSYSTGNISAGFGASGGLIGLYLSGAVSNCFWDTETTGQATSGGGLGTGKTTSEMKTLNTFFDAGWDFETIWGIDSYALTGYPFLQSSDIDLLFLVITNNTIEYRYQSKATNPRFEISTNINDFSGAIIVNPAITYTIALGTKLRSELTQGTTYYVRYVDDAKMSSVYSFVLGNGSGLIRIGS